jgi:hypothetical protein
MLAELDPDAHTHVTRRLTRFTHACRSTTKDPYHSRKEPRIHYEKSHILNDSRGQGAFGPDVAGRRLDRVAGEGELLEVLAQLADLDGDAPAQASR